MSFVTSLPNSSFLYFHCHSRAPFTLDAEPHNRRHWCDRTVTSCAIWAQDQNCTDRGFSLLRNVTGQPLRPGDLKSCFLFLSQTAGRSVQFPGSHCCLRSAMKLNSLWWFLSHCSQTLHWSFQCCSTCQLRWCFPSRTGGHLWCCCRSSFH